MRKVLVAAIAFSLVLISGAFLSARAQSACGCDLSWLSPCNWHLSTCCPAEAPAAAEVPAPQPPPAEAVQPGCGCDLSWLNPCNWHLSTCCPAEAPAAVEVPAPQPPAQSTAEPARRYGWDIYSALSRCQFGCPCNCPQ